MNNHKIEIRNNMIIEWDVPIPMEDGVILRSDIFRPIAKGTYPILMTYGPYGKGLAFQEGYADAWKHLAQNHPEALKGSSCKYYNWEVVDPEIWVKDGYACIRIDSRGAGRSKGKINVLSPREAQDYYQCIEWAAIQPWSNGKVGLNGISYYAVNQWHVAGLKPPHLAAICVWEGFGDYYRDQAYHGGIPCTFLNHWYQNQIKTVQYGYGSRGAKSRVTDEWVAGDEDLSETELLNNRTDLLAEIKAHPLADQWHTDHSAQWDQIEVPFLTAANWGGQGVHPRGSFEAFMSARSKQKWLECHGLEHWTEFYTPYGVGLQKQFFDHFLKGIDNGWQQRPRVMLNVRHVGEQFVARFEQTWPLPRTQWTKVYLNPANMNMQYTPVSAQQAVTYPAQSQGVTFLLPPMTQHTEITGPVAAKLFVSSNTNDADLFLILRLFTPDMTEIMFAGSNDPRVPIAQGWLRASHRKLDTVRSAPWRPYHAHDQEQPLVPGEIYELDVEIWPTSIVVPIGYRLALSIRSNDFRDPCTGKTSHIILHDDRAQNVTNNEVTIHVGADHAAYLLLPIIP